jgi:Uma2 family endonuclease
MSSPPTTYLTPEEYLAIERKAESKSEYINGEIVSMTGASREHNLIVVNIAGELGQQLRECTCEMYTSSMRVRVPLALVYIYPDAAVVCDEPKFEDDYLDTLLNPTLIIEVLSESTEGYDRGKKFGFYRTIPSLAEYLLIAQDEQRIEQYTKQPDGRWLLSEYHSTEDVAELASIQCQLALTEVYDKVVLP